MPNITKNNLDLLHETATRYKKTAKIILIVSYCVLLLGFTGVLSFLSIPFGFIFAGVPFAGVFILYVLLQIPILILTTKANRIFEKTSPTYTLEQKKERAKNILMYKILLTFIAIIVLIFLFVIYF
jgi:hypothetical protein